jgi:hypothetical protein
VRKGKKCIKGTSQQALHFSYSSFSQIVLHFLFNQLATIF